jgi:hypothetical protein
MGRGYFGWGVAGRVNVNLCGLQKGTEVGRTLQVLILILNVCGLRSGVHSVRSGNLAFVCRDHCQKK